MPTGTPPGLIVNEPIADVPPPDQWMFEDPFTEDDWLEAVNLYSPAQLGLGRKRSHAILKGYIPFDKLQDACLFFMGFSWVDDNGFLRRETPCAHPWFTGLFATEIVEAVGVQFISKVAAPDPSSIAYATYDMALVTVAFSQPPYEVLTDGDLDMSSQDNYRGQELRRWVNWHPENYVDLLDLPGGQYTFKGGPFNGKVIPGLRQQVRAEKSAHQIVWHNVPIEFVCDVHGFMPKITNAIGKCSSDNFFNQPIHTWILDNVQTADVYADPIATIAFAGFTRRLDLTFTFKYFNPPNGDGASTENGWRLQPGVDGFWYEYQPQIGGGLIVPREAELLDIFTYWQA